MSPAGTEVCRPAHLAASPTLEAVGYLAGRQTARHVVRTPEAIDGLTLDFDLSARPWDRARKDHIFCYASLRDAHGTVVPDAWENVAFGVTGGAMLVGANPFTTDGGIASILVQTEAGAAPFAVHAVAAISTPGPARILHTSLALGGQDLRHELRRTATSAELVVKGRPVASLDLDAPKFRIPANAPPATREPFRR